MPLLLSVTKPGEHLGIDTVPADTIADETMWSFAVTEHMTAANAERSIPRWRLWLARHADVSGHWQASAAALAQIDFWLEQNPLPVYDRHGRRLPTLRSAPDAGPD